MMHHAYTAANLDQRANCAKLPRKVRKARGRSPSPSYCGLDQRIGPGNGMRVAVPPAGQRQGLQLIPRCSRCGDPAMLPPNEN